LTSNPFIPPIAAASAIRAMVRRIADTTFWSPIVITNRATRGAVRNDYSH
jgi:hypothetical protein